MNPLLPVVRELAEALIGRGGKLYSKSSTTGPHDLAELRVLLDRAGMPAAAWLIADFITEYNETIEEYNKLIDESEADTDADERFDAIGKVLQRGTSMAEKLKTIAHIIKGREDKVPIPPADDLEDDIPF